MDRFGVVAPAAGKRAPLKEDGGSDTRSVVKGKSMYIEYERERLLHQIAPVAINCSRLAMKANLYR